MIHIEALSLGAGVQSTTIALAALEGLLPKPDVAVFADTGWEPAKVYSHLARLAPVLEAGGIEVFVVSSGNIRTDSIDPAHRFAPLPWFVRNPPGPCSKCKGSGKLPAEGDYVNDGRCTRCGGSGNEPEQGIGRRQCTSEYKLVPIRRKLRELLGAKPPEFRYVPRGNTARQWIGFSTDEIERVNDRDDVLYLSRWHPLLDLEWSRNDCKRFLAQHTAPDGTPWIRSVTKSACVGCPYRKNAGWRTMRDQRPAEFADAVAFDAAIRKGGARGEAMVGEAYLHRTMLPLAVAPIDRIERKERREAQTDLFEEIANVEAGYDPEIDGDPDDGDIDCGPYGCASGVVPVELEPLA